MVSPLDQLSEECNRLMFEAVNENSLFKLKLAKSNNTPSQLLTSLAQRNEKGETPLTVAMKRKNVPVIKEMVTWMLDYKNLFFPKKECKPMPIFIIDEIFHHIIPVLESDMLYDQYDPHFYGFDGEGWLELIGLVFLQSTSLSRQDKITALELIGALAIIHCYNSMSRLALKCWREAMTLRYFPQDGESLLPKVPAICVPTRASSVIFGSADEIMTMEELKSLEEDFERNSSSFNSNLALLFKERLLIQGLLVMRRIFTQANLGNPHWLYLESFLKYANFFQNAYATSWDTRENIVINIHLFIFEQLNGFDPKLISRRSFNVFITTIRSFSTLFIFVWSDNPSAQEELTFDNLLALTKFVVTISEFFPNPAMISSVQFGGYYFAKIVNRLLCLLGDISSQITDQEKHQLEEHFSYFIRNFFPERTPTVLHCLHWAANEAHMSDDGGCFYSDGDIDELEKTLELKEIHTRIKLILHLGADVNAIDERGRTPLHLLAEIKEHHLNAEFVDIFQTLVDAGSHLYLADDDGKTVISILRGNVKRNQNNQELPSQHYFESLINSVFPLTWFCARAIQRHRIPFKDRLPLALQKLVSDPSVQRFHLLSSSPSKSRP